MTRKSDTEFDLTTSRIIRAPQSLVWSAWADPVSFAQWWISAPTRCKVVAMELADHPKGAGYNAYVMHKDRADRDKHEKLGFHDGWGAVMAQLAALVESGVAKGARV